MTTTYNMLTGVDLSPMDDNLFFFLAKYASAFQTNKIYFLHMSPELELPDKLKKQPFLSAPPDEAIGQDIESRLKRHLAEGGFPEYEVEVKKGGAQKGILYWSKVKDVDLILLGVKEKEESTGLLPDKLVKVSNCSVLLIPSKKKTLIRKICVAIDFSEISLLALQETMRVASGLNAEVRCVHVYSVPSGYHYRGKDYDEFIEVIKENAIEETHEFLEKARNKKLQVDYVLDEKNNVASKIKEYAAQNDIDMLVAGSKGRTAVSTLLVGSTAEKLTRYVSDTPLLIFKKKNENMDFFDALTKV